MKINPIVLGILLVLSAMPICAQPTVIAKFNVARQISNTAGIEAEVFLRPTFSIQPGLLYAGNAKAIDRTIGSVHTPHFVVYFDGLLTGPGASLEVRKYGPTRTLGGRGSFFLSWGAEYFRMKPSIDPSGYYYSNYGPEDSLFSQIPIPTPVLGGVVHQLNVSTMVGYQVIMVKDIIVELGLGPQLRRETYYGQSAFSFRPAGNLTAGFVLGSRK